MLQSATRFDNDSYYRTMVDEENSTARIIGTNNGEPVDWEVGGGGGGSSDFSTATLTMVGEAVVNGSFYGDIGPMDINASHEYAVVYNTQLVGPYVEDHKFPIVLYKGKALIQVLDETVASYSGDITPVGNNYFFITGDCTITIS